MQNSTVPARCGKKVPANRMNTGSRALHDMNGFINMVINRLLRLSMVRVAIIAGTLQPKPMTKGMNDLPCSPAKCMSHVPRILH